MKILAWFFIHTWKQHILFIAVFMQSQAKWLLAVALHLTDTHNSCIDKFIYWQFSVKKGNKRVFKNVILKDSQSFSKDGQNEFEVWWKSHFLLYLMFFTECSVHTFACLVSMRGSTQNGSHTSHTQRLPIAASASGHVCVKMVLSEPDTTSNYIS